jgi:hypothetical protein
MKTSGCVPEESGRIGDGPEGTAVVRELIRMADQWGSRFGMSRRAFLKSQMGWAATFLAMNRVFGTFFDVNRAEASEKGAMAESVDRLRDQFVFDVQVHYLQEGFPSPEGLLSLRRAADRWRDHGGEGEVTVEDLQFEAFYQKVFEESQTRAAVLSNAPDDDKAGWFLSNEQALGTRDRVNRRTGRRSLLAHGLFTPGQPGWMEDLERVIEMRPDAWKGYTLGDPGGTSQYTWRLDDEDLVYPAYEKMEKAGIRTVCVHKGLLPTGYRDSLSDEQIESARVGDVGKAARDWPNLDFVIYHSAIEKVIPKAEEAEAFEKTGRIDWVTNLAEIPEKFGVENVYAELGAVFAATCVAHPGLCAGVLGTLLRGFGPERVCWGTDSVWFGSPQWQIEAFRRIEIPEEMQRRFGFPALGPADSPIRRAVLGGNSARLYGLDPKEVAAG